MTVFAVYRSTEYNIDELVVLFTTREKAEDFVRPLIGINNLEYFIYEEEVL